MSDFEFQNPLNWNLVTRLDLEAVKVRDDPELYAKIPDRSILISNRILMIGCRSRSAKPRWRLGCYASKRLLISPSSTTDFPSAVYTERHFCLLGALTLIKFSSDGPFPCLLVLDVPYWLSHLYIEVWSYDGADDLSST